MERRARFGVTLPQIKRSWDETRATATLVDSLGFDSLWVCDHLFGVPLPNLPIFEAWSLLAAVAPACLARTHTVRPYQALAIPAGYSAAGLQVAIEGDSIIVLADRADGRSALLYRRGTNGAWAFNRVLLERAGGLLLAAA